MDDPAIIYFHSNLRGMPSSLHGALSFATPGEVHGVQWIFTLDNYRKLLEPVYLDTFVQSFQLAITSTVFITLMGIPLAILWQNYQQAVKRKLCFFLCFLSG